MAVRDRKRPSGEGLTRSAFLRTAGRAPLTLRIDPEPGGRAFASGPAARATHLEREVPAWALPSLAALRRAIERAPSLEDAVQGARDALLAEGAAVDRRDEPATTVRRHPAGRLALGADRPLVDVELLGLELGARSVAKRMCPPGGASDRVERFRAAGLVAVGFGVTTHGAGAAPRDVVLVARDEARLLDAQRVERALVDAAAAREDDASAVRDMGALLGYPACCVERFVLLRARDDASLAGALLGSVGVRVPFATAFTVPPFTLVSHAPCAPECPATLALVARLLQAMTPTSRALYASLAEARWGVDDEGHLVRRPAHGASVLRIDPADPALVEHEVSPLELGDLHWEIETVLSAGDVSASELATAVLRREG